MLLSALVFFLSWSQPILAQSQLVVDLGYSQYEGYYNASIKQNVWQGIRYAAPPLGENRFRAPQPPATERHAVFDAKRLPERCPRTPPAPLPANYNYTGSEDCLFLSVYSPKNATNLPVWFWIHGGGYGRGQGDQDIASFSAINNSSFVSVVIQYRLGALGFLAGDEVYRFGHVNNGLRDQHFALEWVQKHISKFGGDPRRVTIAGQSAGAGSVMLQAMAYGGRLGTSLFENSIAATPYTPMQYNYYDWQPSQAFYAFAQAAGCFPGRAYGNTSSTIIDCLRQAPSDILQNASTTVGTSGVWGTWGFLPVTDGDFIRDRPSRQLRRGQVNGRRVLTGNTANEAAAYVQPDIQTDEDVEQWLRLSYPLLHEEDYDAILNVHYPASNISTTPYATCGDCGGASALNVGSFTTGPQQRVLNLYSEATFICGANWLAEAYSCSEGREAYRYQYSVPAAEHGADLDAVLRERPPNVSPQFFETYSTIWGNMVVKDNPSVSNLLANGNCSEETNPVSDWPLFTVHGEHPWQMINFNLTGGEPYSAQPVPTMPNVTQHEGPGLTNDIRLVDAYSWEAGRGARCEFWRNISDRVPQ